ncbi:MAG: DUF933 domain-containing protein [Thermodesulfobacteriota bacterium]
MKLGIVGLPGSGKSTVFKALTGGIESGGKKGHPEPGVGVVKVKDDRLDYLTDYHHPKKTTPVFVEYLDIAGFSGERTPEHEIGDKVLSHVRPVDALVHCVRMFSSDLSGPPRGLPDYQAVEEEMILSDLVVVEKRIERISRDIQRGRKELAEELGLLEQAKVVLDQGRALRTFPPAWESDRLRGFAFLSAKPELVLLNAGDDTERSRIQEVAQEIQDWCGPQEGLAMDWLYADSEAEIARLDPEDAKEFLAELQFEEGAKDRIIRSSFKLLNLIVFFTAGEPEVRAWQLKAGQTALKAAGTVHSDMERGFIRAEVVSYRDFREAGSMAAAQKAGKTRLEGRDYVVQDGDIILFRFNV